MWANSEMQLNEMQLSLLVVAVWLLRRLRRYSVASVAFFAYACLVSLHVEKKYAITLLCVAREL